MNHLRLVPELVGAPTWRIRLEVEGSREWDWDAGEPDVSRLDPVRQVRSAALSRHIPVRARSSTTQSSLLLESGLELQLMTLLDWCQDISWLVPQPVELRWSDGVSHAPDLLSLGREGGVTLWDARPEKRRNENFELKAARTNQACKEVGWKYETFAGLTDPAGLNLRWLCGARRPPEWLEVVRPTIIRALESGPGTIGDLRELDRGRGFVTSTMWHLIWTGELSVDLEQIWDDHCLLVLRGASVGGVAS